MVLFNVCLCSFSWGNGIIQCYGANHSGEQNWVQKKDGLSCQWEPWSSVGIKEKDSFVGGIDSFSNVGYVLSSREEESADG